MLLHDEVVFNPNGTISMVPKHPLVWDEELSMGNREDDIFMLPNIALLVRLLIIIFISSLISPNQLLLLRNKQVYCEFPRVHR